MVACLLIKLTLLTSTSSAANTRTAQSQTVIPLPYLVVVHATASRPCSTDGKTFSAAWFSVVFTSKNGSWLPTMRRHRSLQVSHLHGSLQVSHLHAISARHCTLFKVEDGCRPPPWELGEPSYVIEEFNTSTMPGPPPSSPPHLTLSRIV
jgi:hypothetical protein